MKLFLRIKRFSMTNAKVIGALCIAPRQVHTEKHVQNFMVKKTLRKKKKRSPKLRWRNRKRNGRMEMPSWSRDETGDVKTWRMRIREAIWHGKRLRQKEKGNNLKVTFLTQIQAKPRYFFPELCSSFNTNFNKIPDRLFLRVYKVTI